MRLMNTYGKLEPIDKRTRRKFKLGGVMEKNEFMYTEVVANHFCININFMTKKTGGMQPSPLRKLGLRTIGLIVAFIGTLPSQK